MSFGKLTINLKNAIIFACYVDLKEVIIMTKIFDWKSKINKKELDECIEVIENGGIVVFPTETVYGIGTNAFCEQSVRKIYEIKNRPDEKALTIMLSSIDEIENFAVINNDIERKIIQNFMPGPITIILERKKGILDHVATGKNTIGIRIPNNNIILSILEKLKLPLVAPSANISGQPSGVVLEDIIEEFVNKVDICIDGGKCDVSESSTIVQVVDNQVKIIRQGTITKEQIERNISK